MHSYHTRQECITHKQNKHSTIIFTDFRREATINRDIPKIIKFKATNSLRVSCLFCIFKHSPQKTV